MNCDQTRRLLSARLDHPLAPQLVADLQTHLRGCAACARFDAQLRARLTGLARLPEAPPVPRARTVAVAPPFRRRRRLVAWAGRGGMVVGTGLVLLVAAAFFAPLLHAPGEMTVTPLAGGGSPVPVLAVSSPGARVFGYTGTPEAASQSVRDPAIGTGVPSQAVLPASPRPYSKDEETRVWDEVAMASGELIGTILRPTYLPDGIESISRAPTSPSAIDVGYGGAGRVSLKILVGAGPTDLSSNALPPIIRARTTVRGQEAIIEDNSTAAADGAPIAVYWEEPGRWDIGTPFVRDRIRYAVIGQGMRRAEFDRIVASLVVQTSESAATDVVRRFYAAINGRDYRTAYALFDPAWQAQQSYDDFVGGFADTARDDLEILSAKRADLPGRYTVAVRLAATKNDRSREWFAGSYEIGWAQGKPQIVGAQIAALTEEQARALQVSPAPPPVCDARQITLAVRSLLVDATANTGAGTVRILVDLTNRGGLCRLTLPFDVTILDGRGSALAVESNGVVWTPNGTLQPGATPIPFNWANWCGGAGSATIRATLGGQSITLAQAELPRCTDSKVASLLIGP